MDWKLTKNINQNIATLLTMSLDIKKYIECFIGCPNCYQDATSSFSQSCSRLVWPSLAKYPGHDAFRWVDALMLVYLSFEELIILYEISPCLRSVPSYNKLRSYTFSVKFSAGHIAVCLELGNPRLTITPLVLWFPNLSLLAFNSFCFFVMLCISFSSFSWTNRSLASAHAWLL